MTYLYGIIPQSPVLSIKASVLIGCARTHRHSQRRMGGMREREPERAREREGGREGEGGRE